MRRSGGLLALALALFCVGSIFADDDGISLTVNKLLAVSLDWSGGTPDYQVYRGVDPATITHPSGLQTLTADTSWVDPGLEFPPGGIVYYRVVEGELIGGGFPEMWINGESCITEPSIQVHAYNADTYILRQSLCTNFEGPFIYLLFGEDKVLMQDTGAGGIQIADAVYAIIDQWLFDNGKTSIDLIVSHSHGHGDHVAGDSQFVGQPDTTVVGLSSTAVAAFFGIVGWPTQIVLYDLGGGRVVDVIPIPGHQSAHIALYDRQTGILFTGDTLYAGRCYISSFSTYLTSIGRMVDFIADRPVVRVLGTHIEMTSTPFVDFSFGSTVHIDEHPLELGREHLIELHDGVVAMADAPFVEAHADFIIFPF